MHDEDDSFDLDSFNQYINMELVLKREGDKDPQVAKVAKRLKNNNGNPIGVFHKNPILDTRLYEVEFSDGHKNDMHAHLIAQNIFSQVDEEGFRHVLFKNIIDMRTDRTQVLPKDDFDALKVVLNAGYI